MLSIQPQTADWQAQLCAGHVISFRFPLAERRARGDGKTRPCLVMSIADHDGVPHALVAYGTSADTPANRGHDLAIDTPFSMAAAGLHKPTRFVGARRVWVPLTSPLFRPRAETGTPIIGRLAAHDRRALLDLVQAIRREPVHPARPRRRCGVPGGVPRPGQITTRQSQPQPEGLSQ